jgi:hypothetical protein
MRSPLPHLVRRVPGSHQSNWWRYRCAENGLNPKNWANFILTIFVSITFVAHGADKRAIWTTTRKCHAGFE